MANPTRYEVERKIAADVAVEKARRHGESTWPFDYRGQQVQVTARKDGDKMRLSTTHVKNKGK
jgi:hypothetical protein